MSDLDAIAAGALSDTEEPHPGDPTPRSGRETCANCDVPLTGDYCSACGQRDQPLRIPAHRFMAQSVSEFFGIDGRVWRTLGALLFRPGRLTAAYLAGKRRRYLRPLRVYLSSTLLFFVLLALLDPVGQIRESVSTSDADPDSTVIVAEHLATVREQLNGASASVLRQQALIDSLRAVADSLRAGLSPEAASGAVPDALPDEVADRVEDELDRLEDAEDDVEDEIDDLDRVERRAERDRQRLGLEVAILEALPADSTVLLADIRDARSRIYPEGVGNVNLPGWLTRSDAVQNFERAKTPEERNAAGFAFLRDAIGRVPTVLFFILPVFALLLKVLYIRRGWYYAEHLVFALHTHAFAFGVFTAVALLATM
ncbi:MAG: DUF3667 domain-containing protein, partial [Bacteroidota bacterium]